jgi:RNA polymerase sigma-70 factor (ECF subfamily)
MDPEEREWIRSCQRGNRKSFEPLVRKYQRRAYFTALGLLGNPEDALETSQEAFMRAFRALARFDADRPFYPWFYRILRNLCTNLLTRGRIRVADNADRILERVPAGPESNPERQVSRKEIQDTVWRALSFLPADHREILILREMQEMTYAEIAEQLEIPIGTVMSRLYHARRELRQRLSKRLEAWDGYHGS